MKKTISLMVACGLWFTAMAQKTHEDSVAIVKQMIEHYTDSVSSTFTYQTGKITLDGNLATIDIPKGLKFLDAAQSKTVLVDLWGNPDATGIMGMLFPEKYSPVDAEAWAFTISYDDMGHVNDDDAEDMDYAETLETLKKETLEGNAQRQQMGYEPIQLINWASTPFYDKDRKVIHWAKELKFGDAEANTLNYDVRVLGRKGILSLNAVGQMSSLNEIKPSINYLLSSVKFTPGNQYSDFNPDIDKVAAWTVGGLVAGKILAKVGILALLGKYLKLIIIAIAAGGGALWKWIKGKREKAQPENETELPKLDA